MRILFLSNYYPPYEVGGYEQLCRDVVERLEARGHDVVVLTSDRRIVGREARDGGEVHRELRVGPSWGRLLSPGLEFFTTRRAKTRHNIRQLNRMVDRFAPDVIFIWNLQGLPIELATACERRPDVTVVYWLAGYSPAEPDAYWRYWTHIPRGRLQRLIKVAASKIAFQIMAAEGKPVRPKMENTAVVSQYMRQSGIAAGTLPPSTEVIYNGVEFERFFHPVRPSEGRPLSLLQAGRVSRDKGVHTSIRAVAQLAGAGKGKQVQLLIAGSGPGAYEQELRKLVADNQIDDQVQFLGWLARDMMPEVMAKAEILLLPTEHPEPFARVVLEGMAAGLTVVGSRTGGTSELLRHRENGLVFEAGDSADLARQIEMLLNDDELRCRLARAGQDQVKNGYTLDIMVAKIEHFLQQALDRSSRL